MTPTKADEKARNRHERRSKKHNDGRIVFRYASWCPKIRPYVSEHLAEMKAGATMSFLLDACDSVDHYLLFGTTSNGRLADAVAKVRANMAKAQDAGKAA